MDKEKLKQFIIDNYIEVDEIAVDKIMLDLSISERDAIGLILSLWRDDF